MKKYDIGIFGLWYGHNYGSMITYYALNKVVNGMGYSTVMIENPLGNPDAVVTRRSHVRFFSRAHYDISPLYRLGDMHKLNELCDKFLLGSDQMWNYDLSRAYKQAYYFGFADDYHPKICYATSFGKEQWFGPDEEKPITKRNLKRFDRISVRDDFSQKILENDFDVQSTVVVDPVFLCPVSEYEKLIKEAKGFKTDKNYIFAYILDPNRELGNELRKIATENNIKIYVVFDEAKDKEPEIEALGTRDCELIEYLLEPTVQEWLCLFKNAKFVLTDSFHGTCFSMIFNKPFVVQKNGERGGKRFTFLLDKLGLSCHLVTSPQEMYNKFNELGLDYKVDYNKAFELFKPYTDASRAWLEDSLKVSKNSITHPSKVVTDFLQNFDFIKIRLLGTLLRDYGIKHVVLSPGGRDVPIIRMFEHNEQHFTLHRVTDERSAAYYALGLASKLNSPVACVCTSGTAASNYLPAVTEAYYTGVPMVVITADRYGVYLNHGEDQTIPQKNIFADVVKMSVSLPEEKGIHAEYQVRRDISSCILETTNGVYGPVHINVPIYNVTMGSRISREFWSILPFIHPHIQRVGFKGGDEQMNRWAKALKDSPRILVVWGQSKPLTEQEKQIVDAFASRYNCVIVTDSISNFNSEYSLNPYNMLNAINQDEFNRTLSPDILITVGGKRLMNDPLTFKVRGGKDIRHWSVTPDGKIKDFYFKLSSVIECTPMQFFKWFAEKATDKKNDMKYLNAWKERAQQFSAKVITDFNALYIQQCFFPQIPKNSFLHLGVGQSFFDVRRQTIDPSVEVYCNMGTNGIDGCTSTFMGQCAVTKDKLCFLIVGDLSFFYDMNAIWNKPLSSNMRILLVNNNGSGLLRGHGLKAVTSVHNTIAKGWVESTGFEYISASSKEDFDKKLKYFLSDKPSKAVFFEVLCD